MQRRSQRSLSTTVSEQQQQQLLYRQAAHNNSNSSRQGRNASSASSSPQFLRRESTRVQAFSRIHEQSSICGRVQTASWSADDRRVCSWTAARMPLLQRDDADAAGAVRSPPPLFAGLFTGIGGRQCASAVAALAADYVAAAGVGNIAETRRRLLATRRQNGSGSDWNNNDGSSSSSGSSCSSNNVFFGRRQAATSFKGLSVSLKSPAGCGDAEFVPEDLLTAAREDWLPGFLLKRQRLLSSQRKDSTVDESETSYSCGLAERIAAGLEQLDQDLCSAAEETVCESSWTVGAAVSGATGVTCLVSEDRSSCLLAQTGDCVAVVGSRGGSDGEASWRARQPLAGHTIENGREVCRVVGEHADSERRHLFEGNCLLGQLEPLRAFGLVRFKWSRERLRRFQLEVPRNRVCDGAPYLTARPETANVPLDASDRFLILGSAGLWDRISAAEAVACVGEQLDCCQKQLALTEAGDLESSGAEVNLAAWLVRRALACGSAEGCILSDETAAQEAAGVAACVVLLPN